MKYVAWFLASSILLSSEVIANQTKASKQGQRSQLFHRGEELSKGKYP